MSGDPAGQSRLQVQVVRMMPCSRYKGSHFPLRLHQKEARGTNTRKVGLAVTPSFILPSLLRPARLRTSAGAHPAPLPPINFTARSPGGQGPPPPHPRTQGPEIAQGPPRAFPHITSPSRLGLGPGRALGLQLRGTGGRG